MKGKQMTLEQKRSLLPLIEMMMGLALISRTQGLLALDELVPDIESSLSWIGLRLIMDGISDDSLKTILANYIEVDGENLPDIELLKLKIESQCLLEIQRGSSPEFMRDSALSLIGTDLAREVYSGMNGYLPYTRKSVNWENEQPLELMGEPKELDDELEYLIDVSSNEVLAKSLFLLNRYEIDRLLPSLSIASRKKIYYSRPEYARTLFIHAILNGPYRDSERLLRVQEDLKRFLIKHVSWAQQVKETT